MFLGATTQLELRAGADVALRALEFHPPGVAAGRYAPGDRIKVAWNAEDAQFFGSGTEPALEPEVNLELGGTT